MIDEVLFPPNHVDLDSKSAQHSTSSLNGWADCYLKVTRVESDRSKTVGELFKGIWEILVPPDLFYKPSKRSGFVPIDVRIVTDLETDPEALSVSLIQRYTIVVLKYQACGRYHRRGRKQTSICTYANKDSSTSSEHTFQDQARFVRCFVCTRKYVTIVSP